MVEGEAFQTEVLMLSHRKLMDGERLSRIVVCRYNDKKIR